MKKIKESKGAATLFVLIAGLFFISFILSVLMLATAKRQTQIQIGKHTQEIYDDLNQEQINNLKNIVPIYTVEQLLKIGSGEEIAIEKENGRKYVFSENAHYVLNSNFELEYNGIWDLSKYNIDKSDYKIKIKDASKSEEIYYYYINGYDYPVTEEGFKYENLILYYDGTNNTGNGHSDTTQSWKDLTGNGRNGVLENFSYNIESGWKSNSLRFDGSDDGVLIGDGLKDLYKNGNAIELKIKFNELDTSDILIGNYNSTNSIQYEKNANNSLRTYVNDGEIDVSTGSLIASTDNEYVILYLFDRSNGDVFIYINGELKNSYKSEIIKSYNYDFLGANIGRDFRTGETCLNGEIYSVRIYDNLLTEQEIKNNYEAEKQKTQNEVTKYSKDQIVLDIDTSYANIVGDTITDTSSGEEYTLQNGIWNDDGSMNFNGTTYMQCGHGGEFDGATELSVATTFTLESFEYDNGSQHIISSLEYGGFALIVWKNKIGFEVYAQGKYYEIYDTEDIQAFEKYNVVGTYDGSQIKLYVNGKLKSSKEAGGAIEDTYKFPITIGINPEPETKEKISFFKGSVYDAKVYKKVLSQEEINKYVTYTRQTFDTPGITPTYTYRTTNRVLDMDSRKAKEGTSVNSGSTSTWYDLAKSTNRTLTNFAYDRTSGWDYNGGLIFDGTDDYVSCGKAKNLNGTKALTMSATVKVSAVTSSVGYVVSNVQSGGYAIRVSTNSKLTGVVYLTEAAEYKNIYTPVIELDKIYNVIFTFDGTNLRIFLNGEEGTAITLTSEDTIKDTDIHNLLSGNPNSNNVPSGENFNGILYDAKIYDAVLTDTEIQQLWEQQNHQYAIQK